MCSVLSVSETETLFNVFLLTSLFLYYFLSTSRVYLFDCLLALIRGIPTIYHVVLQRCNEMMKKKPGNPPEGMLSRGTDPRVQSKDVSLARCSDYYQYVRDEKWHLIMYSSKYRPRTITSVHLYKPAGTYWTKNRILHRRYLGRAVKAADSRDPRFEPQHHGVRPGHSSHRVW